MAYADNGSQFLNKDFNIDEYIAQAPTPPPSSLLQDDEWAGIDGFDFGIALDNNEIDFELTNSQKLTLGQADFQAAFQATNLPHISYDNSHLYQLPIGTIKEEPVDSIVSTTTVTSVVPTATSRANNIPKCMNRNAIAARENRQKKKADFERMKTEIAALRLQNDQYHKENKDLKSRNKTLNERLTYLEKSSRDSMRMAQYSHMHNNDKYRAFKKAQLRSQKQMPAELPVGICVYIRPDKEMEFRMCESCANHNGALAGPCVQAQALQTTTHPSSALGRQNT